MRNQYSVLYQQCILIFLGLSLAFLQGCSSSSSDAGANASQDDTFVVPSEIKSEVLQRCLSALADEKGWLDNSDVKKIICEPEDKTDYGWGVQTLEGIQLFTNLEELVIYSDYLYSRQIKDISPLSSLTRLKVLELYNVAASSFEPIENITSIERLTINPTYLSDLSPITKLENLQYLYLGEAYIYYPLIEDFSPLIELINLEELHIISQQYNLKQFGISFLESMKSLKVLNLRLNYLTDLNGLQYLTNLEALDLSYNYMFTFSTYEEQQLNRTYLTSLENIRIFIFEDYDGPDIDFAVNWQALEYLLIADIYGNDLFTIDDIPTE